MSIAQLIFKKGNFIDKIEFDAVITEGATATARLTENPVESGANINDHIIIEPMTFTVEGVVSNSASSLGLGIVYSQFNDRAKEAWNDLLELQITREPFTLVQGLKEYNNVVILSLSENQNKETANGLFFTATMKEIIFVGSEIITEDQFNDSNIADQMIDSVSGGLKQLTES